MVPGIGKVLVLVLYSTLDSFSALFHVVSDLRFLQGECVEVNLLPGMFGF